MAQQLLTSDKLAVRDRGRDVPVGELPAGLRGDDRDTADPTHERAARLNRMVGRAIRSGNVDTDKENLLDERGETTHVSLSQDNNSSEQTAKHSRENWSRCYAGSSRSSKAADESPNP